MFNPQKSTVFTSPATGQIFMLAPNQQFFMPQHDIVPIQQQHRLQLQADCGQSSQVQQFFRIGPAIPNSLQHFQMVDEQLHPGSGLDTNPFSTQDEQKCLTSGLGSEESQSIDSVQGRQNNTSQQSHATSQTKQRSQLKAIRQQQNISPLVDPSDRCRSSPRVSIDLEFEKKCLTHYIDGQLIYETSKLRTLKKAKKQVKKRKLADAAAQVQQQQLTSEQSVASLSIDDSTDTDDVESIRRDMVNWTVTDVVKFIESISDIRQHSNKFEENEIDGKALLLLIDRNLNLQTLASMFKHGPAMKIEAALFKYKLNQD